MKLEKLSVFLVMLLLITTTFIPVVSAEATSQKMEKIADKITVSQISGDDKTGEYIVTYKVSDTETKTYQVKKFLDNVDGKEVIKAKVYEQNADGTLAASETFGKDSYAYYTGSGWAIHLGPVDMGFLRNGGTPAMTAFGAWLALVIGLTGGVAIAFAAAFAIAFVIGTYFYTNNDGSMDIEISDTSMALIPIFIAMPGSQPVPITVKGMSVILLL
jgi:hypothetical protein